MATLLPPPKRKKLYHGIEPPAPEPEAPVVNVVVQFISEDTGKPLAPAVNLPADLSREGLELLVNQLSNNVRLLIEDLNLRNEGRISEMKPSRPKIPSRLPFM